MTSPLEGEVVGAPVSLRSLNEKALVKLDELLQAIDSTTDPEMILAVTKGIAQMNSSLKGSDILPREETAEERTLRLQGETLREIIDG